MLGHLMEETGFPPILLMEITPTLICTNTGEAPGGVDGETQVAEDGC